MTILAQIPIQITHAQIFLKWKINSRGWYIWTDEHSAQGFAYGDGVASFGVPDHDGRSFVKVELSDVLYTLSPDVLWAVKIPCQLDDGLIRVSTVSDDHDIKFPNGAYSVVFEARDGHILKREKFAFDLKLSFFRQKITEFEILKSGTFLTTTRVLRKDAELGG